MRVLVCGAGIIGLSVADELLRRGHDVSILDPAPGQAASYAAAGMLSPSSEVWHGEEEILRLGMRSLALWPAYAGRLGVPVHRTGTLLVAQDRGDLQQVERQVDLLARLGGRPDLLSGRETRALEPTLGPRVAGGALLPEDHSVDPRQVVAALLARVGRPARWLLRRPDRRTPGVASGVTSCEVVPEATGTQDVTHVPGVPRPDEHDEHDEHDVTIIATGAQLPEPWAHLVRGVRGEILRGHSDDPPSRTVRAWAHGQPVYVVPRPGGEVVIGATSEEHDGPAEVTLGGVFTLLEVARAILPGLDRARLTETTARDRPASPDNLPLIGPAPGRDDVLLAAGFFRHGVLLAPLAAQLVADHLEGRPDREVSEPTLDPSRFTRPPEPPSQSTTQEGAPC